ncbi:hypothetical protein QBC32DRAFT_337110 [Pseudoneurospora amorphoporcata]|uniref:Uncharacterized protein n=1 Tax=Pseudoneurospora amorphoporcata TaxID=241081 RepID=A0AAN6P032_9PEZI|nr:hypothetical protein QBC32DRAFT_337110 [Pseudoneurospora amorphoporcata]
MDLLNLHNGHQQLGGVQTGYVTGGGQFNHGSQHPSRVHTPQGGAGGYMAPGNQQPGQFNGMQHGQGGIGRQSNNGSQQASRAPTPQGGVSGYLAPVNQQLNQINGRQHGHGGASGYLDPGFQQYNSPQPLQGGGSGHLSPIAEDQPAGWPNVAGGNNQHLYPGNQQAASSQYGAGGVVQPAPGYQQFPGSQFGVGGQPHPGVQPQPGHGSASPHAVQNNNGGTPDANHPPAIGSAPPELHPPPVVTPPVFPPNTLHPERWVAPGSGNEVVKIRASKFRNQSGGIHPHHVYYYRAHTQAWGTEYDEEGRPKGPAKLFSYANSQPLARAELVHSKQYTASQLSVFFRGEGHPNRPNRHLTLWIQNLPLLVSDRYAQANASKCRYNECPVAKGTITKGFHRIAFDENSHHTGDYYDPYNNAGYMHLWCFEKAFDAGYLVWDVQERPGLYNFRIEADVRHHRFEEKNAASLNRDHNLHDTYRQWKNEQWDRYVRLRHQEANTGQRYNPFQTVVPDIPHDNCLWRRLTDNHVAEEVPARAKNRAKRTAAGNTIDNHRGDLVMYTRLDNERKGRNGTPAPGGGSQQGTPAPLTSSANKRKRNSAGEEDEEYQEGTPTPGSKKSRTSTSTGTTSQTPNRSGNMGPPPLPSSSQRRTRRSSLALAHDLGEQLGNASGSPLTRSRATFLGQQLNQLPEHLQEDVISHAPQSVQVAITPLFLQNWRPENWGEVLRDRVSRMTPYHQGLLMQFAEKTERKGQLEGGKRRWRSDP